GRPTRRARSARTASTKWTVSTWATYHAARINAVREGASSTARSRRGTAGSSWRMLLRRHRIEPRPPLEPLARESKSGPHVRCYASPPRTETYAQNIPRTMFCAAFADIFLGIISVIVAEFLPFLDIAYGDNPDSALGDFGFTVRIARVINPTASFNSLSNVLVFKGLVT